MRRKAHPATVLQVVSAALLFLSAAGLSACSLQTRAQRHLAQGDPFTAVRIYEQIVANHPGDPELEKELSAARQAAASDLADRAEAALRDGREELAVKLSRQASGYDPAYRELEAAARHKLARSLLDEAGAALEQGRFDSARGAADRAGTVAHDLAGPEAMLGRINEAEAERLASDARALAEAGAFDRALESAHRAVQLRPGDEGLSKLPSIIEQMRRLHRFDALAVQLRADLDAGRLADLPVRLGELEALAVGDEELSALKSSYEERSRRIDAALGDARAARVTGRFQEALGHFKLAQGLATDRPDIAAEQAACEIDGRIADLLREGRLALQQGKYDEAAGRFARANDIRASSQATGWLKQTRAAQHRQAYTKALEANELTQAAAHLQNMLRYDPDENAASQLAQMKMQIVEAAIAEASQLYAADKTDEAVARLDSAMPFATDTGLSHLRADLAAEGLLRRAVDAEMGGDYRQARSLYMKAMAEGGDRQAVSQRIDDLPALIEMQELLEQAEAESTAIRTELASTRRSQADLESDLDVLRRLFEIREAENEELKRKIVELSRRLRR